MKFKKLRAFAYGIGAAGLLLAIPGLAQKAPGKIEPVTYDNWTLSCAPIPGTDGKPVKTCEVRSDIMVVDDKSGQKVHALTILFARASGEKTPRAVVRLPLSVFLGLYPRLVGGDGKPVAEYGWVGCQPQLCGAMVTLTDAQMGLIRKMGDKFSVQYRNQFGQDVRIDGSTKGLFSALDALAREK